MFSSQSSFLESKATYPSLKEITVKKLQVRVGGNIHDLLEFVMKQDTYALREACQSYIVQRLQQLVLDRKEEDIKKILKCDPELLFIKGEGEVVDHLGQKYPFFSAYQLAIRTRDLPLLELMKSFIIPHDERCQLALKQAYEVIFKSTNLSYEALSVEHMEKLIDASLEQEEKEAYDFSEVVAAISAELFVNRSISAATKAVLDNFRQELDPQGRVIKLEMESALARLAGAWEIYDNHHNQWNRDQQTLFCIQVIGYLERLLSSVDATAIRQGISQLVENKKPLLFTDFRTGLRVDPQYKLNLGYNCYFNLLGTATENPAYGYGTYRVRLFFGRYYNQLLRNNNLNLGQLFRELQEPLQKSATKYCLIS